MKLEYTHFFQEWIDWEAFEPRFDGLNGVYAFRLKSPFPRLKGKSRVIYIGMYDQDAKRNRRRHNR